MRTSSDISVFVSNAYSEDGKLMTGASPAAMVAMLEGMGADAIGVNCSLGPDKMLPTLQRLAAHTSLPLAVKLNAGLPDPQTGEYSLSPEEYAAIRTEQMNMYLGE